MSACWWCKCRMLFSTSPAHVVARPPEFMPLLSSFPHFGAGLIVTPIPVQHGPTPNDVSMSFEIGACLPYSPSPAALVAASPPETGESAPPSSVDAGHVPASRSPSSSPPPVDNARPAASSAWPGSALVPFALPAFNGSRILYVSDVNAISSEVRAYFLSRPTDLLILDCLNYRQYSTHFCMLQSINCALDIRAKVTRFVGMNHRIDHELEHGFLQAWGRALRGQPVSSLQPSIASASDASATNGGETAADRNLHSASCGADAASRVDHYGGGPLDIGLAHDGQPFAVSIDHSTTLQEVEDEVQAVLRYVASQKHTPASADDPTPSPSDSNAYSKAAAGDGCACNNDRDGNSGGDGKAAHSISSTSSGAAPVSASSASAAAATSPSPAGAIPAAAVSSKQHSAHSYLHSHVKSIDPAAEGSFSPSADAIAVGRQQHPPSWKPEAGARAGAETDSAAHQAAAAAAADSSGSGGAASTNGVAARGSGSASNPETKAATMPGPGGEVRLSTADVTRAETDHYDYLHPQRPEFDDANSPTVVKLLQGWSFK